MHNSVKSWLKKSREELDEIYRNASPGEIPSGDTRGTAILTGSLLSRTVAAFARLFAWQGDYHHRLLKHLVFCQSHPRRNSRNRTRRLPWQGVVE